MKITYIGIICSVLFMSGCATINQSTYQDGKALGKGVLRLGAGADMSPMVNSGIWGPDIYGDPNTDFLNLTDYLEGDDGGNLTDSLYFWGLYGLDFQYGATEKIDVGFQGYLGMIGMNFGGKLFAKYAFAKPDSKLQYAAVPYIGYGVMEATDIEQSTTCTEWCQKDFGYNTLHYGLDVPISFHPDNKNSFYLTAKMLSYQLKGNFVFYDKNGRYEPSLDPTVNFGIALGSWNKKLGSVEATFMYEIDTEGNRQPRIYAGYRKSFDLFRKKNQDRK